MNENKTVIRTSTSASPVSSIDVINGILTDAAVRRASDVHIDPTSRDTIIRMRIDGELEPAGFLPCILHEEAIARLKILSGARTDIHAVPQDGRFRAELDGRAYNVRVSFMPTYRGENAVLRLLPVDRSSHDSFASLGFTPEHVQSMRAALAAPNGLILVTGPTGSGKTTTLCVCLGLKAAEPISVMTLEDPVEYEVPGVRHVHIRHGHGVTFASGLRSALRQDPDVIMLGEIRDSETARTAMHMALTGHLVFSTLHTTSAAESITRLMDMGIERYVLASAVRLIVSQRLVRRKEGDSLKGSIVIAEVLEVTPELRSMIGAGASAQSIEAYAREHRFRTMQQDAEDKVAWGITTHEEVCGALYS